MSLPESKNVLPLEGEIDLQSIGFRAGDALHDVKLIAVDVTDRV